MRVFGRALILGGLLCAFAPARASAAPILLTQTFQTRGCEGIVSMPANCTVFELGSLGDPLSLNGTFASQADVALFEFMVGIESTFFAETTSYLSTTGFNSMLGLFDASTGLSVTYRDPNQGDELVPARGTDVDPFNDDLDDQLGSFALGPGRYFLALLNNDGFANGFTLDPNSVENLDSLALGFGCDDPSLPEVGLCTGNDGSFSLTLQAISGEQPQPIPEPGTLALLGTGLLAAVVRRRTKKRN